MAVVELCDTCGVPKLISSVFSWENSGIISISYSPGGRMVFYESANIDSIFRGVEELIGVPIEHIVMERKRRDTRRFMERVFAEQIDRFGSILGKGGADTISEVEPDKREEMLEIGKMVNAQATMIGMVYGYGDIRFSELWDLWDTFPWRTQIISNPYSLIFFPADMLATIEALEQRDMRVGCEKVNGDVYLLSVRPGEHPIGLKERLKRKHHEIKEGDISHDSCPQCGIPLEVARCHWNLEEGTITDPDTGRRMALFDPAAMDTVFEDLEEELGESVPDAIVEAQRRYGKLSMGADDWRRSGYDFKNWAALRGLGNITSFKADGKSMSMTLENPSMNLALVGMAQALYELAQGAESSVCEWQTTEDGDLIINITL